MPKRRDKARKKTEELLAECERLIDKHYSNITKEMIAQCRNELKGFEAADNALLKDLNAGTITNEEYKKRRTALYDKSAKKISDNLAKAVVSKQKPVNKEMANMVAAVAAENLNYAAYVISAGTDISFDIIDAGTAKTLKVQKRKLCPDVESPDIAKLQRWNRKVVNACVRTGVRQGASIPKIAESMRTVTKMNKSSSIRTARTSCTMAENAGRLYRMEEADKQGGTVKKQWIATLDDRTREEHRYIDGEMQNPDDEFSNGCMYPGDPDCDDPSEVWNCRCTMVYSVNGQDFSDLEGRAQKLHGMSYDDWLHARPKSKAMS